MAVAQVVGAARKGENYANILPRTTKESMRFLTKRAFGHPQSLLYGTLTECESLSTNGR